MGRTPPERARARRYDPSTQQPGFREPTSDAFGVLRSQRLPGDVFVERVLRVDLFELAPDAAGPIDFAEMAESGSEYDTGKIRPGHEENPLPQQGRRRFVLAGKQVCHTEEVERLRTKRRVKTHGMLDRWNRFQRLPRVDEAGAKQVVGESEIRIKRQRYVDLEYDRNGPVERRGVATEHDASLARHDRSPVFSGISSYGSGLDDSRVAFRLASPTTRMARTATSGPSLMQLSSTLLFCLIDLKAE
jgi:hypothetical protein